MVARWKNGPVWSARGWSSAMPKPRSRPMTPHAPPIPMPLPAPNWMRWRPRAGFANLDQGRFLMAKSRMTRKQKRLAIIGGLGVVLALATTLVLVALRDQIVFFYSTSEIASRQVSIGQPIRLGGL